MTTLEVLRKTRALLADPARWTRGAFALDDGGGMVDANSSDAVRFCLLGAAWHVTGDYNEAMKWGHTVASSAAELATYNDRITHDVLLRWLDTSIAKYEEFDEGAPVADVPAVVEPELALA